MIKHLNVVSEMLNSWSNSPQDVARILTKTDRSRHHLEESFLERESADAIRKDRPKSFKDYDDDDYDGDNDDNDGDNGYDDSNGTSADSAKSRHAANQKTIKALQPITG